MEKPKFRKDIYIWGAGHYGVLTALECERKGIKVLGFIDSNANELKIRLGLPVMAFEQISNKSYIIIAVQSKDAVKEITEKLETKGFEFEISKSGSKAKAPVKNYEFINWLSFANAGMLSDGNIFCFEYAIQNLPSNNPVIEIGSFCGLSTNLINFYIKIFGKNNKIITTDKWIFEYAEKQNECLEGSDITHSEYKEFVKETYIKNTSFFSKNNMPYTIETFSDEFFDMWHKEQIARDIFGRNIKLGGGISFAYVDGNHTYEYAKRDFINIDKNLDIGGFILFDDSSDSSPFGVCDLMKEIDENSKYERIIKNPNYLFRKKA